MTQFMYFEYVRSISAPLLRHNVLVKIINIGTHICINYELIAESASSLPELFLHCTLPI